MTDRVRQPKTMPDSERVRLIYALRKRKWSYAKIGKHIGMSANGVKYALHRVTDPTRHLVDAPEEV